MFSCMAFVVFSYFTKVVEYVSVEGQKRHMTVCYLVTFRQFLEKMTGQDLPVRGSGGLFTVKSSVGSLSTLLSEPLSFRESISLLKPKLP